MTTQLTFNEFKVRHNDYKNTRPSYLQFDETDKTIMFKYNMYLKGRVPVYAK